MIDGVKWSYKLDVYKSCVLKAYYAETVRRLTVVDAVVNLQSHTNKCLNKYKVLA